MAEEISAAVTAGLRLAESQSALRPRIGHLALMIVTIAASVALASLLATEDDLPLRTTAALATLLAINLSWAAYSAWVLTARNTMLFNHRVVAGWIAVSAATVFSAGAASIAFVTHFAAAYAAAGSGLILLAIAVALLMHAKRKLRALRLRRFEIEARLSEIAR